MNLITNESINKEIYEYNIKTLPYKIKNIHDNQKYHLIVLKIISSTKIPPDLYKYIKLYIGYRPIILDEIVFLVQKIRFEFKCPKLGAVRNWVHLR